MTTVGNYSISKTTHGYVLLNRDGEVVGTFPTARSAWLTGVDLTAAAYRARVS